MTNINFFGATDIGRKRSRNEDTFIVQHIWDDAHILAVVIDGMGGYAGGEIAAETARRSIIKYLEDYPNGERLDLLKQAVVYANNAIYAQRKSLPEYGNMGCVATAILLEPTKQRINLCHVGDTRLYRYNSNGELSKLSHDHSLVGYREEIGDLTETEAMQHPQRNIIERDMGDHILDNNDNSYLEVKSFPLENHSSLLLCSDGLSDMITSQQIKNVLQQQENTEEKVNELIAAANNAGGKDNITVVLIDCDSDEPNSDTDHQDIVGQHIATEDADEEWHNTQTQIIDNEKIPKRRNLRTKC